jgi:hypothetical protein
MRGTVFGKSLQDLHWRRSAQLLFTLVNIAHLRKLNKSSGFAHDWTAGVALANRRGREASPVLRHAGRGTFRLPNSEGTTGLRAACDDAKAGHERGRQLRRPYFFKGLGRTVASHTVSTVRPASSAITKASGTCGLASWLGSLGRLGWFIVRTPDRRNRSRPYP